MASTVLNFGNPSRKEKEIIYLEEHAPEDSRGKNNLLISMPCLSRWKTSAKATARRMR